MEHKAKLWERLEEWHQQNRFREIIDAIEALPRAAWDYGLICQLARAYNNRGVLDNAGREDLERALELLDSVAEQGAADPLWHFRRGYALYYLDREAEALPCFEEAARLDPADPDAPWFAQQCRENLRETVCYTREELKAVGDHIAKYFGEFENVLHELESAVIHVDMCLIPPKGTRNYITLVTMGMGALPMRVPANLAEYQLERAELVIALPPDWPMNIEDWQDERYYWPLRLLKKTARLPGADNTWLGWGHTVDLSRGKTYAADTGLCGTMLVAPQRVEEAACRCALPDGSQVNFYQLIPLYRDELDFIEANGTEELLAHMRGVSFVVDPRRPHADLPGAEPAGDFLMDDAGWHLEIIREKQLPVEELCAYNHLAVYLRWCLEHNADNKLLGEDFMIRLGARVQAELADLRRLIRDELGGRLDSGLFGDAGRGFARYYYGASDDPYFPTDVDNFTRRFFGDKRYALPEFQQEAYLFLPFGEDCYQGLAAVISRRFAEWQGQ